MCHGRQVPADTFDAVAGDGAVLGRRAPPVDEQARLMDQLKRDAQLQRALDLLKGMKILDKTGVQLRQLIYSRDEVEKTQHSADVSLVWFEHEFAPPEPFPGRLPGRWRAAIPTMIVSGA